MPVICIGPICIPWAAIPPIIFFIGKPIWAILPEPAREKLKAFWEWLGDLFAPIAAYIPFMKQVDKKKKDDDAVNETEMKRTKGAHNWNAGSVVEVHIFLCFSNFN